MKLSDEYLAKEVRNQVTKHKRKPKVAKDAIFNNKHMNTEAESIIYNTSMRPIIYGGNTSAGNIQTKKCSEHKWKFFETSWDTQ